MSTIDNEKNNWVYISISKYAFIVIHILAEPIKLGIFSFSTIGILNWGVWETKGELIYYIL